MKTPILLTIGAAVLATAAFNLYASNALLTPRAAGNQIKVVASTPGERDLVAEKNMTIAVQTPKMAANETAPASVPEIVSAAKCKAIGTPRQITAAGNSARTSCCGLTLADCPDAGTCAKK